MARDLRVRINQRYLLRRDHDRSARSLIVFMVPGANPETGTENLWGGVMAICRIGAETSSLRSVHGADVLLCTIPGETPLLRHMLFPSTMDVFRLEQVLDYFTSLSSLTLHVPEYASGTLPSLLSAEHVRRLALIEDVHVNVLNQNIDLLPSPDALDDLRRRSTRMTMTTAHRRYCTEELSGRYRMPVHHLSVPIGAEEYVHPRFVEKDDLVLFSPDDPEKNARVAEVLVRLRPQLELVEIRGVPYLEYRGLLERARWMFAFGEGLDYYFVESVFSGGVAFAVFNDRFFPPALGELDTVYPSFDDLLMRLDADFGRLSEPISHELYSREQRDVLVGMLGLAQFRENLRRFLGGDYTWRFDERPSVG